METNKDNVAVETAETKSEIKTKKVFKKKSREDMIPPFARKFPAHILNIALLIHNNAEIKRFTALGIINYLQQKGEINGDKKYVVFRWNKFSVRYNGLSRDYHYTEPFFLNALVASFSSFSASSQTIIDEFIKKELNSNINSTINVEEVAEITALNEKHTKVEVVEE